LPGFVRLNARKSPPPAGNQNRTILRKYCKARAKIALLVGGTAMSRPAIVFAAVGALLGGLACAQAAVVVTVDKSAQQLSVTVDGAQRYQWPVSTARWGYRTPNGTYRPQRLERKWFSRKYDWSPMPYSIFFDGGYAIHGSYEISRLGHPASHGCIRLHPENAALLFALVKAHLADTTIVVTGSRQEKHQEKMRARVADAPEPRHRRVERERRVPPREAEVIQRSTSPNIWPNSWHGSWHDDDRRGLFSSGPSR
jgi:hypothetical protein